MEYKSVYFRAFEPDDAILINRWHNDERLNELTLGLSRKVCFDEDKSFVEEHMKHNPFEAYWAICSKETGTMIGWACLVNIHFINSSAETGAIIIGDSDYNDGYAWIETVLFMFEYAFERLNLNRVYGKSLIGHKMSNLMEKLVFMKQEGVLRQAAYKNGMFYDLSYAGILKKEYHRHKEAGEYELQSIIHRLKWLRKESI